MLYRNIPKAPPGTMPYRASNQARQLAMMLQKNLATQERYLAGCLSLIGGIHGVWGCIASSVVTTGGLGAYRGVQRQLVRRSGAKLP